MTTIATKTANVLTAFCFGLTLAACGGGGGSGGGGDTPAGGGGVVTPLSKTAVLQNAASIISARYAAFSQQSATLNSAVTALCAAPSSDTLAQAQQQWKTSMNDWQQVVAIDFGPAATDSRSVRIHSYPIASFSQVSAKADEAISPATGPATISAETAISLAPAFQGLNTLEYLLFDTDVPTLQVTPNRRCEFAAAVANNVAIQAATLNSDWNNSFPAAFTASTNVDAYTKSLLASLVNYLVIIQTNKLIDAVSNENDIESPLADVSIANIRANIGFLEALIGGATDNGFAHYLTSNNAQAAADKLATRVQAAKTALDAVTTELVAARADQTNQVLALAEAVHQLSETMASEVASGFGVTVEFTGGDGD